jgi:ribosome-associated toxin RatA of RatAB toxin-antitoxin module
MKQPHALGPMPGAGPMSTVDERVVRAPLTTIFALAVDVEAWPQRLDHYRSVRFIDRRRDGGGTVEMSANRPFGVVNWPTWWTSLMTVSRLQPGSGASLASIRFRHIRGITTGMEVEWAFEPVSTGMLVRIVHVWNGPAWPVIGDLAARAVIGPVFVHGIASRTLAGLARAAERTAINDSPIEVSSD